MWALMIALSVAVPVVSAGYCSTHTFPTNSSWLQFTKETIPIEYAIEGNLKSIHCCGKGYRSIEWFKDTVAYPWSAGVSNMILYPEEANQTLYTRRVARHDAGNYTCRMSNETHSKLHMVRLEVIEKQPDAPKTMFVPRDQWVKEGSDVRFYCEALFGRSYLADAQNDLSWQKVFPNGSEDDLLSTQREIKAVRDHENIVGAYLEISPVTAADYGTYVCTVRSNDVMIRSYVTLHYTWAENVINKNAGGVVPWRILLLMGFSITALLVTVWVVHSRCTPRILLAARLIHARATPQAHRTRVLAKEYDVLVAWTPVDDELVRGALLPTLTYKYSYRVMPLQIATQPDNWYDELIGPSARCRSLVCVMSPSQHSPAQLFTALRQLRSLPLPPVVVLLQDVPKLPYESKDSHGENVVRLLRRTRLVPWRHLHERAFWTSLRLALPLPPASLLDTGTEQVKDILVVSEEDKYSRSGSIDALV